MVFQQFNLWPRRTALGNVTEALTVVKRLPRSTARELGITVLTKVGLGEKIDEYPSQLSGGEQQRVAIARALRHEPHGHAVRRTNLGAGSRNGRRVCSW